MDERFLIPTVFASVAAMWFVAVNVIFVWADIRFRAVNGWWPRMKLFGGRNPLVNLLILPSDLIVRLIAKAYPDPPPEKDSPMSTNGLVEPPSESKVYQPAKWVDGVAYPRDAYAQDDPTEFRLPETDLYAANRCLTCGSPLAAHPVICARHPHLVGKPGVRPLYRIASLADFANVPVDRIYACMVAFADWVADYREATAQLRGREAPGLPPMRPVWTWVDAYDPDLPD